MWGLLAIPSIIEMIISDFRSRTVRVRTLAVTCILLTVSAIIEYGLDNTLLNITANGAACILIGLCTLAYLRIRKTPISEAVGCGDILFILSLTPLFRLDVFLLFMTVSSALILSSWFIYTVILKSKGKMYHRSIPLVSGLGICVTSHLIACSFVPFN